MDFNEEYIRRLKSGDRAVEDHFAGYFGELLRIKLRSRLRSPALMEDARQETFLRVLRLIREDRGPDLPDRLGAFVNSVCNNVVMEQLRAEMRHELLEEGSDPADARISVDEMLITEERKKEVKRVLAKLPPHDLDLLRMVFFEERDKDEVCRTLHVDRGYLRVLLHRAKARFRERFVQPSPPGLTRSAAK